MKHQEPEQYISQLISVAQPTQDRDQRRKRSELRREDFDLQSGIQSDLHSSVYRNSLSRLQDSIGQLKSAGLIRLKNSEEKEKEKKEKEKE